MLSVFLVSLQVRDAGNLLTRAGLAIPTVDVDDIEVYYPDPVALIRHLRRMGESNALLQRRSALPRDTALAAAAAYMALFGEETSKGWAPEEFRKVSSGRMDERRGNNHASVHHDDDGGGDDDAIKRSVSNSLEQRSDQVTWSMPATFQVVYMTGWNPDPSQPKAAKRGSATVSLKDISEAMKDKES